MLSAEGLFAVNDEGHGLVSVVVHPDLAFAGMVVKFIGSLLYMRVAAAIEVRANSCPSVTWVLGNGWEAHRGLMMQLVSKGISVSERMVGPPFRFPGMPPNEV
ncbi:hypothetical protein CW309_25015 [Pseudomonas hunanensis]|uniref:Uncharacterized protein n=1 Tax=Pseudomonas hunanensis TaxID=1247546 RepID=A0ACC9MXX6_9PSED|nr:hypothetical protein CW309_25015 [Pseudomonas hunanensis]